MVIAANDVVTVHSCPATYTQRNIRVEMRSTSRLDIQANSKIGQHMIISSAALVTHSNGMLTVGSYLLSTLLPPIQSLEMPASVLLSLSTGALFC
jgi:hypothetical protein